MSGIKKCGITIALLNAIYSFAYSYTSAKDARHADKQDVMPFVWLIAYFINEGLNLFLVHWLFHNDLRAIMLWFSYTGLILVYRIFGLNWKERSSNYIIIAMVVNAYILISSIVMYKVVAHIKAQNAVRLETVQNLPGNSRRTANRTGTANTPRTYGWNTNNSRHYSTQPEFFSEILVNERNNESVFSEREFGCIASSVLNHQDSSNSNCCDNSCGADNQSGGGADGGCCDDGGGCDSGGGYDDGGGYDGGCDAGGYDCGGGNDD
ncbi:uncharacterized protein LOC117784389 [Drosophila innubila]|uniref:uncharacterized protein LOC117784389 n=1 Tax=Drosophila innubila TaxID=198719 RepID=UPI00148BC0DF|nr:uncharacterized protein LOC117784389 [Drosophila innubila]